MMSRLTVACEYLGVSPADVVKSRVEGDDFILIVNLGIKGVPKYRIPLSELGDDKPRGDIVSGDTVIWSDVPIINANSGDLVYEPKIDATDGALTLATELGINLSELYDGERLTVRDVRRYAEEQNNE